MSLLLSVCLSVQGGEASRRSRPASCCVTQLSPLQVGGVPEILPRHLLQFAEPNGPALLSCLSAAVSSVRHASHSPRSPSHSPWPIAHSPFHSPLPHMPPPTALLQPSYSPPTALLQPSRSHPRHASRASSEAATFHREISAMYSWHDVARRTRCAHANPTEQQQQQQQQ